MFRIKRDDHRRRYTCISNKVIMDKRLSLAARGFFAVVLSLPDSWDFSVNGMAALLGIGRDTILRYMRELEELGYVVTHSDREQGRFTKKGYSFFEVPSEENTAEETTVTEKPATVKTVTENTSQSNTKKSNTKEKENTISIKQNTADDDDRTNEFSQLINAETLRNELGDEYVNTVVRVISDCTKASRRTINGDTVENAELKRVFGKVSEEDVRRAAVAIKGKRPDNLFGYLGSVLFNQIKSRLDKPQLQPKSDSRSSFQIDEVMREVMAKYL